MVVVLPVLVLPPLQMLWMILQQATQQW